MKSLNSTGPCISPCKGGWRPAGLYTAAHNPLDPVVPASHGLLIWPLFPYAHVVWEGVESFANI